VIQGAPASPKSQVQNHGASRSARIGYVEEDHMVIATLVEITTGTPIATGSGSNSADLAVALYREHVVAGGQPVYDLVDWESVGGRGVSPDSRADLGRHSIWIRDFVARSDG